MNNLSMTVPIRQSVDELVINWHLTEACNYSCRYCYAHWDGDEGSPLCRDRQGTIHLLDQLQSYFLLNRHINPLFQLLGWKRVRITLSGGEPLLLGERLGEIITLINQRGFDLSLISNGSLLNETFIHRYSHYIDLLGISIDSTRFEASQKLGRCNRHGHSLDIEKLSDLLKRYRQLNPSALVKINTVVSRFNQGEELLPTYRKLGADKVKLLQLLATSTSDSGVSTDEFYEFVERHQASDLNITVEDNLAMTESYLMIAPHGRFFQNGGDNGQYRYSQPIVNVGVIAALGDIRFNVSRFASRYGW